MNRLKKKEVLTIWDKNIIDSLCLDCQFRHLTFENIPLKYKGVVYLTLRYGSNWWKHTYIDKEGYCIYAYDRGNKYKNIGIITKISIESDTVKLYDKNNPKGYQKYSISYSDMLKWLNQGSYKIKFIANYIKH